MIVLDSPFELRLATNPFQKDKGPYRTQAIGLTDQFTFEWASDAQTGGNAMSNKIVCMCGLSLGLMLSPIGFSNVSAQEKCKVSEGADVAKSTYTQQHTLDVGDVPGHQVRIYEIHRTYPNDKPNCEGLRRTETWERGYSNYIDWSGPTTSFGVITLENGDKIFTQNVGTSQTTISPDGTKNSTYSGVTRYTGGTGKYKGIRGLFRVSTKFDPEKNVNLPLIEGEYWLEK
jgi:hypothetical protein